MCVTAACTRIGVPDGGGCRLSCFGSDNYFSFPFPFPLALIAGVGATYIACGCLCPVDADGFDGSACIATST